MHVKKVLQNASTYDPIPLEEDLGIFATGYYV